MPEAASGLGLEESKELGKCREEGPTGVTENGVLKASLLPEKFSVAIRWSPGCHLIGL